MVGQFMRLMEYLYIGILVQNIKIVNIKDFGMEFLLKFRYFFLNRCDFCYFCIFFMMVYLFFVFRDWKDEIQFNIISLIFIDVRLRY